VTAPAELLSRVRQHLTYVSQLFDAKKTLHEHRRLLTVGGWLSLLASTCHIDLRQFRAATTWLRTASQLAGHAERCEIAAWCLETEAWQAVTTGDYRHALTLSQGAQRVAPRGSSAYIQATAQEGRIWARLGARSETRDALHRVDRLVEPLPMPAHPEHHYRYDPSKREAYVATTPPAPHHRGRGGGVSAALDTEASGTISPWLCVWAAEMHTVADRHLVEAVARWEHDLLDDLPPWWSLANDNEEETRAELTAWLVRYAPARLHAQNAPEELLHRVRLLSLAGSDRWEDPHWPDRIH
jgi:hypothetical protein